jgi:tRNA(adenine34) deaminase
MQEALEEAALAKHKMEVPIGAVIVHKNQIIGRGHNLRESLSDATAHAEILAIKEANHYFQNWRLSECDIYVTLEPCPMCAGAILQSRIRNLYFGTSDPKAGCAGTFMNLLQDERFNHQTNVYPNILPDQCASLLKDFFRSLRKK